MIRATRVLRRAERGARASADTITLSREERWRRRIAMQSDNGLAFLLDLPEATYLAQGDALELSDGRLIEVRAAAEDLLEIRAVDALALARIAWHIGNRHTPAEITPAAIYIQADHVLAEMAAGLGAEVTRVNRPFEPEGGAYDGAKGPLLESHHHGAASAHSHSHSHSHAHAHAHAHGHDHDHSHSHTHGDHHRHGHGHDGE